LYHEAHKTHKPSYLEGKKCAMPRSFRLVTGRSSDLAVMLQPAFTRQHKQPFIAVPLWLIAHNLHARQFLEQLTITEKAELLNRDNLNSSTGIRHLDKFRIIRQYLHIYLDWLPLTNLVCRDTT
jgi:hypothetical protein